MPRARIWQLIESGALDFSLSGITNEARDKFAGFAWYFSNKYYLLVRKSAGVLQLTDFENDRKLRLAPSGVFDTAATRSSRGQAARRRARQLLDEPGAPLRNSDPGSHPGMIIEPFDYSQVEAPRSGT